MKLQKKKERVIKSQPPPDRRYTTPQGKTIIFNDQQYQALQDIKKWLGSNELFYTLSGYAGTGKSSIVGAIIKNVYSLVVSAPTHKAKMVISKMTGQKGETIQALLGLKPNTDLEHFSIADPQFDPIGKKEIQNYRLVIIDEASMLNKELFQLLQVEANKYQTKVLFMGDEAQLPPVNEAKSKVFKIGNISHLTKVERQQSDNPLMSIYDSIRDNITSPEDVFKHSDSLLEDKGIKFYGEEEVFREKVLEAFLSEEYADDRNYSRVIAYTNATVKKWNSIIRDVLIGKTGCILEKGDLLMAYNSIRLGAKEIYNSADYEVVSVVQTANAHEIDVYKVVLKDVDDKNQSYVTNFLIPESQNVEKFKVLARRYLDATKGKTGKARSQAWAQYFTFKNQHLLMSPVGEMKKDFDYGYAITVHKSLETGSCKTY